MGKDEILQLLNDKRTGGHHRRLLEFCCEPQTYDERVWEQETQLTLLQMFEVIKHMKAAGGLEYIGDRKWQTTDLAKSLL